MRDRILEIVIYMVDYIQQKRDKLDSPDELSFRLKKMGYSEVEISSAYSWLMDRYDETPEVYFTNFSNTTSSNRVLTEMERLIFTTEAYGYLLKLLQLSLVDQEQFEAVIDKAGILADYPIGLEEVKMLVASVVFREEDALPRHSDSEDAYHTSIFVN